MAYEIAIMNPRSRKRRRKAKARSARKHGSATKMARRKTPRRNAKGRFVKGGGGAPKRRRRKVSRAVVARAAPRRRRRSSGGKRRPAMGYVVGTRKIRRRKLNPRMHRRRHRRYNPRFSISGITSQLMPAAYGAAGGIALDVALGYLPLPAMLKTGYAKHATRIVGALGLGWLASKVRIGKASAIGQGALTVAVYGLMKDLLVQFAPSVKGLGDYEEIAIDNTADQIGAYLAGGPVGAYLAGPQDDSWDRDGASLGAYMGVPGSNADY